MGSYFEIISKAQYGHSSFNWKGISMELTYDQKAYSFILIGKRANKHIKNSIESSLMSEEVLKFALERIYNAIRYYNFNNYTEAAEPLTLREQLQEDINKILKGVKTEL